MADESDLEEELLQVAGRSRGAASKKRSRAASDDEGSLDLGSDDEDRGRGRGRGKREPAKKKPARGRAGDSEDEDGNSDDSDDLYEGEEDRKRLEAMTELDREMILAERSEKRDKARQRKEILKKAGKLEQKGAKQGSRRLSGGSRKRKEESEEEEEEEEEVVDADDDDEPEWQEEEEEEGEEEAAPTRRVTRAAASGTDKAPELHRGLAQLPDDDEDEALRGVGVRRQAYEAADEEMAPVEPAGGSPVPMDTYGGADDDEPADPHEIRNIQLTRPQLESMCDKPFFEGEALAGAVVRIAYGAASRDKDGNPVTTYWMMQIVSIKEQTRSYPFGPKGAPCNKHLELRDGYRKVRIMAMNAISSHPLDDAEIERFARHASNIKDRPISKQQALEVKARLQSFLNYRWDAAEVKEQLRRKRQQGYMPVNIAAEKTRLRMMIQDEKSKPIKNLDAIQGLEADLAALEERERAKAAETRNVSMSAINQRNKEANFNLTIRNVSNRPANAPERKGGADPFSRRVTRPNIYWSTGQQKAKEEAAKANGTQPEDKGTPTKAPGTEGAEKLKGAKARMDPTELVKLLDIDVDTSQLQHYSVVPPNMLKSNLEQVQQIAVEKAV